MTNQQLRWLLFAVASGLLTFVAIRRRQQLASAIPQPFLQGAERFVIPWPSIDRKGSAASAPEEEVAPEEEEAEAEAGDSMRRKVSSGSRISFRSKRYGPLPEALVGQYVDVETRGDQLFVLHEGQPIATFSLQS
jgi:hypothetical protein